MNAKIWRNSWLAAIGLAAGILLIGTADYLAGFMLATAIHAGVRAYKA